MSKQVRRGLHVIETKNVGINTILTFLIRSFLDPLRARIKVSGCVVSLVLCYISHWCLCVASALCLRVTCVWCRYIRVSSLFFRVLVLFQLKSLQGSFPRPYNSLKVHL